RALNLRIRDRGGAEEGHVLPGGGARERAHLGGAGGRGQGAFGREVDPDEGGVALRQVAGERGQVRPIARAAAPAGGQPGLGRHELGLVAQGGGPGGFHGLERGVVALVMERTRAGQLGCGGGGRGLGRGDIGRERDEGGGIEHASVALHFRRERDRLGRSGGDVAAGDGLVFVLVAAGGSGRRRGRGWRGGA